MVQAYYANVIFPNKQEQVECCLTFNLQSLIFIPTIFFPCIALVDMAGL